MTTKDNQNTGEGETTAGSDAWMPLAGSHAWRVDWTLGEKLAHHFWAARQLTGVAAIHAYLVSLQDLDSAFHMAVGGDLHRHLMQMILGASPTPSMADPDAELGSAIDALLNSAQGCDLQSYLSIDDVNVEKQFDSRYLLLMQWVATADQPHAEWLHPHTQALTERYSHSWVRWFRIGLTTRNTGLIFKELRKSDCSFHPIIPWFDDALSWQSLHAEELPTVLTEASTSLATGYVIEHPAVVASEQEAVNDDSREVAPLWADSPEVPALSEGRIYALPQARVSCKPTGIAFKEPGDSVFDTYRYVYGMSDRHQYFRLAGEVALGDVKQHLDHAWLLPRFSINNHYHTLIERLPCLFAYQYFNLSLPIVSAYQFNDTERWFAEQLLPDMPAIVVDDNSAIEIGVGYLAHAHSLLPLFARAVSQLAVAPWPTEAKKLYISRSHSGDRPMRNEESVHALVEDLGFTVVHMESWSLVEQIALLQQATTVMAPHGAGLANMIFAPAGCQIIELLPRRYAAPMFKRLATQCGHPYAVLLGEVAEDSRVDGDFVWEMDSSKIARLMQSLATQSDVSD